MVGDTFEIYIQTIKEQMRYDRTEFSVAPGMKVRLIFSNPDAMDHNLLMVEPGAAAKVAIAAAKMETTGDGVEKQWRPDSDQILFASKLLAHGEKQIIEFTAPIAPGRYDYICTFPGHWQLMRGVMIVSNTIDAANILASQITIDELGEDTNRQVVEYWEFDMLKDEIDAVQANRSYNSGKAMFQVATCSKCHKMGDEGETIGPDLKEIHTKFTPSELLEHILDPAISIEEEYKTFVVETKDNKEYFGQIIKQDDNALTILDNPLTPEAAITVAKSNISLMEVIEISPMPTDLLIMLKKDEIWDLLAYLISAGNPDHEVFNKTK